MSLSIGIVGLPNVGKSTLFNALLKKAQANVSNYPFCTIEPNVGIVGVPDDRLEKLAKIVKTEKVIPATVEFIDIAGLVSGAARGEGLGNKFLAHIRECDAIAEVIRDFSDPKIIHVEGKVDPASDIETIKTELILADLETMEKKVSALEKEAKIDPQKISQLNFSKKIKEPLEKGIPAQDIKLENKEEEKWIKSFQLISFKPHIYIFNVDEDKLKEVTKTSIDEDKIYLSAKTELELIDFSEQERKDYLKELGQKDTGLDNLIKKAYDLLGLMSFFTAGEKEVRAWTIKKGWTAPFAAGVIHTDFLSGFIKAEVINWEDLIASEGWANAREAGKVRLEGKDYIVAEGDVMIFKFSL